MQVLGLKFDYKYDWSIKIPSEREDESKSESSDDSFLELSSEKEKPSEKRKYITLEINERLGEISCKYDMS